MVETRPRRFGIRRFWSPTALFAVALGAPPARAADPAEPDLAAMELEALMEIEVTSVSKRAQRIAESPAAVHVITNEDIRRSGVTTLAEALRMSPGLHVAQIDATHWSLTSRGFADEFSNKLLVLVDGRSIYAPIFSGVLWNEHDIPLEDIDRIEVVRGPGGTLWGANAVNGVINVITKPAAETQGLSATSRAGSYETYGGDARFGGAFGDDVHYRVYGKFADRGEFDDSSRGDADDEWQNSRTGARLDWSLGEEQMLTLQGDFYDGRVDRVLVGGTPDQEENRGGNLLARFTRVFSPTAEASVQAYWDRTDREQFLIEEERDTFDIELQHGFRALARNQVTWGAGYRIGSDEIDGSAALDFDGGSRTDDLVSFFAQDEIEILGDLLSFTIGSKLEHNDYTGFEIQPSGRLLLTPHRQHTLWGAVSRAVRTPSRVEDDVIFTRLLGPTSLEIITGDHGVDSEKLIAYELGYRGQPLPSVGVDLAAFYNDYDDLRTAETYAVIPGLPSLTLSRLDNGMDGEGWGFEVGAGWSVTDFFRLRLDYTFTQLDLQRKSGSNDPNAEDLEDRTPHNQVALRSRLNLPWRFSVDSALAWVDGLDEGDVDDYVRLDTRLAWRPARLSNLELSLVGLNLVQEHREFGDGLLTQASKVPRSVYGAVGWSY